MGNPDACTCLEVFGEDPDCPMHSYEALENRIADLERLIEAQHGDVVSRTAKLLYAKDDRIAALEAQLAEKEADNERLKLERDAANADRDRWYESSFRATTLSRTGAVKVKALDWSEYETDGWADRADAEAGSFGVFYNIDIQEDGYRVVFDHEAVGAIGTFDTADEAKAAAQADYEYRILSALETAAPEGRQDAVTTVYEPYPGAFDGILGPDTRPSEQAMTEALFEALKWFIDDIDGSHTKMVDFDENVAKARSALKAAMEAGRHD